MPFRGDQLEIHRYSGPVSAGVSVIVFRPERTCIPLLIGGAGLVRMRSNVNRNAKATLLIPSGSEPASTPVRNEALTARLSPKQ